MVEVIVVYGSVLARLAGRPTDVIRLDRPFLGDLLRALVQRNSEQFARAIIDPGTGCALPWISVLVNEVRMPLSAELKDGDKISFLIQLGGG